MGDKTKKHRQEHQKGRELDNTNHLLSSRAVNITNCRDRLGDCMAEKVRTVQYPATINTQSLA